MSTFWKLKKTFFKEKNGKHFLQKFLQNYLSTSRMLTQSCELF